MKTLILIILMGMSSFAFSSEWISPIDIKYRTKNESLFNKFSLARNLVSSWQGQNERLVAADKILKEILQEDPEFAPAYREYGRIYVMYAYSNLEKFKKNDFNLSEQSIFKSIQIEPQYADAYVLLGHLYTHMGEYNKAQTALNKGELLGTRSPWLSLNWADYYLVQSQYNKALQQYINVLMKPPSDKKAYLAAMGGLTKLFEISGDYENARIYFMKQLEYEPESAWALSNYANLLLFSYGNIDEAIKNGQKALSISDNYLVKLVLACALYTKWALYSDTSTEQVDAQKYFDQAWSLYPYLNKVIDMTIRNKYTNVTAIKLQSLLHKM